MRQDEATRSFILKNIKIKDRLHSYIYRRNRSGQNSVSEPTWVKCSKCADSPFPGYLLKEPRYDGLHPSAMGHPCLLKIYKEIVGTPGENRTDPRMQLIFDQGTAIHLIFQAYGLNGAWGPQYKAEAEINAGHQELARQLLIEGHADAENILLIDEPGAPLFEVGLVHEYKSINDNGFKKLTGPKPEHKQQATLYSAALNRPIAVYLYMNKNDGSLADFPIQFNPDVWSRLQEKALLLKQFYETEQPPAGNVGFHCRDCNYMNSCADYAAAQPKRSAR
jgi:hypothetical protein